MSSINTTKLRRIIESARSTPSDICTSVDATSQIWVIAGTCGLSLHKIVRKKEMRKTVNYWREKRTDDIIHELQDQEWEAA